MGRKDVNPMPTQWSLEQTGEDTAVLHLTGDWKVKPSATQDFSLPANIRHVQAECATLGEWGTFLPAFLHKVHAQCLAQDATLDVTALPAGVQELLRLAWAEPAI